MASGHMNRVKRPDTWLHRPMLRNVKKVLANPEPSTHDPTAACRFIIPPRWVQKSPGRCRGLKFAGDRKLDQYLATAGPPKRKLMRAVTISTS